MISEMEFVVKKISKKTDVKGIGTANISTSYNTKLESTSDSDITMSVKEEECSFRIDDTYILSKGSTQKRLDDDDVGDAPVRVKGARMAKKNKKGGKKAETQDDSEDE